MVLQRCLEFTRELLTRPGSPGPAEAHLKEALLWLYRAHDAGNDRGVSHSYEIGKGWLPSYPETTGYIIPTLLNIWKEPETEEARRRALEMAEWELSVRLSNGAIAGLTAPDPVVFDTGQVVFGWVGAYQVTEDERFLKAAVKAGNWLLKAMDEDGVWRGFTGSRAGKTFNARVAWALAELGLVSKEQRFSDAARRFLVWSLEQEQGRGWFDKNCLTDDSQPLLHTIAYTAQGQLEAGVLLDDSRFIEAASRTARELAARVDRRGRMSGRYNQAWKPTVRWACLTGMAQISIVWSRLYALTEDPLFSKAATRVNAFLMSTQDRTSRNGGLRGGIRGSFPVSGAYCRYRVPNWATKFFLDALMYRPATGKRAIFKG